MPRPEPSPAMGERRSRVAELVENPKFTGFITGLILINAVTLGLETDRRVVEAIGPFLFAIDRLILVVFTVELALKLYAYRFSFFRSGWNLFDLAVVGVSWLPATGPLAVLRALRVLRVLRLLSVVPQMRRVVGAIGRAIPGMLSVVGVLAVLFYVASVLTTKLFGRHPDANLQEWFGSIGASAYTLFQVMTLESWSMGIVRPVMEIFPYAWLFFVPFIIVSSFAVLNLFIGIIVDAMSNTQEDAREAADEPGPPRPLNREDLAALFERFDRLERELQDLKAGARSKSQG